MNYITKFNIPYLIKLRNSMHRKLYFTGPGNEGCGSASLQKLYEQGTQKSNHVLQIYTSEG